MIEKLKELAGNILIFGTGAVMLHLFIGMWLYGDVLVYEDNLAIRAGETLMAIGAIILAVERTIRDISRWLRGKQ